MADESCDLKFAVTNDKKALELAMIGGDGQSLAAKMDAGQLSEFLKRAGLARATMAPPVPAEPDSEIMSIASPHCRAVVGPTGHKTLYVRHPAFGWLALSLDPTQAKQIGAWLAAETETAPA